MVSSGPGEPNSATKVEAKLQDDYDFHDFNKESEEDKDENDAEDEHDEDDELLYGDIKGTNETMGGGISTNHTTSTNLNLVNGTKHAESSENATIGHPAQVEKTESASLSSGNSDTNPSNSPTEDTSNTPQNPPEGTSNTLQNPAEDTSNTPQNPAEATLQHSSESS